MPRISRAIAVGYPHHITQRGNYRQTVFSEADDYARYLELLALGLIRDRALLFASGITSPGPYRSMIRR